MWTRRRSTPTSRPRTSRNISPRRCPCSPRASATCGSAPRPERGATVDSFGDSPVPARDDPEPTRRFAAPALLERRSLLLQVGRQLFRRQRLAEVVALHFVAASALEESHLVVC